MYFTTVSAQPFSVCTIRATGYLPAFWNRYLAFLLSMFSLFSPIYQIHFFWDSPMVVLMNAVSSIPSIGFSGLQQKSAFGFSNAFTRYWLTFVQLFSRSFNKPVIV